MIFQHKPQGDRNEFSKAPRNLVLWRSGFTLAAICLTSALAAAGQQERGALVITSTNAQAAMLSLCSR
jgi:hypothetical protein